RSGGGGIDEPPLDRGGGPRPAGAGLPLLRRGRGGGRTPCPAPGRPRAHPTSALAAAGRVAGPILACQQFGWLPCLLWIGLGVVFIGAVHDFSTLIASGRHQGRSAPEIIRVPLGPKALLAMMAFIWVALVYVILAFTDITASSFVGRTEDLAGASFAFNQG